MSKISQIIVNISKQRLYCMDEQQHLLSEYPVSTSMYGAGNQEGSFRTPLGEHCIAQKIGKECSLDEVFIGREPQGQLAELMATDKPLPDDIITSRILWLRGLQMGINQGDGIDSYQRYIYIHGTPEENRIGEPASHGCVRMRNQDVAELFDKVEEGCRVLIQE